MTSDEITERVSLIRQSIGDDESAHSQEDDLYRSFISYVASLDALPELSAKAKMILKTQEFGFSRWCA